MRRRQEWRTLDPAARETRLEALDIACQAAASLYPTYERFGEAEDGTYFIQMKNSAGNTDGIEFVPGSTVMTSIIESAVA